MAHNVGGGERRSPAIQAGLLPSKSDSWSSEAHVRNVGSCIALTAMSCWTWLGANTTRATTLSRKPLSGSSAMAAISAAQGPPQAFPKTMQLLWPSASMARTVIARKSSGSTDGSGAKMSGMSTVRPPSSSRVIFMTSVHSLEISSHAGMPWRMMTRPLLAKPSGSRSFPIGSTRMQSTVGRLAVPTSRCSSRPPMHLATSASSSSASSCRGCGLGGKTSGTQWPWEGVAAPRRGSIW
mmetsp:Transcript_47171/g.137194  ORF Transcript_47171/g.137194 Transcript_47171/m.137194 type:complete len:238 (-) Transcript_47171:549-1262(-)